MARTINHLLVNVLWSGTPANPWDLKSVDALGRLCRDFYSEVSYSAIDMAWTVSPFVRVGDAGAAGLGAGKNLPSLCAVPLKTAGIDATKFERVSYITPRSPGEAMAGYNFGAYSWLNCGGEGALPFRIVHETGHAFGLPHPAAIQSGITQNGNVVSFLPPGQGDVKFDPTGDATSVMSYQHGIVHFSLAEKEAIGWLPPTHIAYWRGGQQTYTLTPIAQPGGALYGVHLAVNTPRSPNGRHYWIEYRQPIGFDARLPEPWNHGCFVVHVAGSEFPFHGIALLPPPFSPETAFSDGSVAFEFATDRRVTVRNAHQR